mgnify:CR=1 FL=1
MSTWLGTGRFRILQPNVNYLQNFEDKGGVEPPHSVKLMMDPKGFDEESETGEFPLKIHNLLAVFSELKEICTAICRRGAVGIGVF